MLDRDQYYNNSLILPPECDVLCPYRSCYIKAEMKGANPREFHPTCTTQAEIGCPPWRNEADDEANLPRALDAATNLIKQNTCARTNKEKNIRQRGFEIIQATAKLLHKKRKA